MISVSDISPDIIIIINARQAWHYKIVPFLITNGAINFYIADKNNNDVLADELNLLTGKKVILEKIPYLVFQDILIKYYPNNYDSRLQTSYYTGDADSFLYSLIGEARNLKSSDIHIETYEEKCRVRIRIDGLLVQRYIIEKSRYLSLVNKIKIISNLDIAEKRLPQDGRIFFEHDKHKFDIRVSILPTLHGEKVVLRLLKHEVFTKNTFENSKSINY